MPLTVDTRKCKNEVDAFGAGCVLMAIGLGEISEKNVKNAQARIDYINALDSLRWGSPTVKCKASDIIGVSANVGDETTHKWMSRIGKNFLIDRERVH